MEREASSENVELKREESEKTLSSSSSLSAVSSEKSKAASSRVSSADDEDKDVQPSSSSSSSIKGESRESRWSNESKEKTFEESNEKEMTSASSSLESEDVPGSQHDSALSSLSSMQQVEATPADKLEERKKQIQDILKGNSSELYQQDNDLKAKSAKNREDRVALARQINALHASLKTREQKRIEVERELSRFQKQSLVNDIMYRKQVQSDYRTHLEKIESDELLLLKKLEAIEEEKARRQEAKLATVNEIQERFVPISNLLHIDEKEARRRIEHAASQGPDNLDATLNRELLKTLAEAHHCKMDKSVQSRQQLTSERFEVVAQLLQKRSQIDELHSLERKNDCEVPYVYGQTDEEIAQFEKAMEKSRLKISIGDNQESSLAMNAQDMGSVATKFCNQKKGKDASHHKNYTLKKMMRSAEDMKTSVESEINMHNEKMKQLQAELDWVMQGPQTKQWQTIVSRTVMSDIEKKKTVLKKYQELLKHRDVHRVIEDDHDYLHKCANEIYLEVFVEGCRSVAELAAQEMIATRVAAQQLLEGMIVKSTSGLHEDEQLQLQVSGKAHLLKGSCRELRSSTDRHRNYASGTLHPLQVHLTQKAKKSAKKPLLEYYDAAADIVEETCPLKTQYLTYGHSIKRPIPAFYNDFISKYEMNQYSTIGMEDAKRSRFLAHLSSSKRIALWESMLSFNNVPSRKSLVLKEKEYFNSIAMQRGEDSIPLTVPSELQTLCLLRCFPRANKNLSLLALAAKNGRFAVYSVPWRGFVRGGDSSSARSNPLLEPVLVSLSPKIPAIEISPVVDLREATVPNTQLVTLDAKGTIRVWSLHPKSKRKHKQHSSSMFSRLYHKFQPVYASCTFYITPMEFNVPSGTHESFFDQTRGPAAARKKAKLAMSSLSTRPQRGTFPQQALFMQSCAGLSGRSASLMVGTSGGDIVKINMDFKEKYFSPKFIHPKAFVDCEFMHSASMAKGRSGAGSAPMIQAAADKDKALRGNNPVYREFFHFHSSPVILLEVLGKVHNKILSIDAEGKLAVWSYEAESFGQKGWFHPLMTAELDLRFIALTQLKVSSSCPEPPQIPHPEVLQQLKPMKKDVDSHGITTTTYQPLKGIPHHPAHLEVQYRTHTASEGGEATWESANVASSLLSAGVLDVQMTKDGEEVVLLMTYEGVRDDGSGDINLSLRDLEEMEKARREEATAVHRANRGDTARSGNTDQSYDSDKSDSDFLDTVTDSDSDEDLGGQQEEAMVIERARRTAEDFEFWQRDREHQRRSMLELERSERDLEVKKYTSRVKSKVSRRLSTVAMNEKNNQYKSAVFPTWNSELVNNDEDEIMTSKGSSRKTPEDDPTGKFETTMFAVAASLDLESWEFHTPLVEFALSSNELVSAIHVGPIQKETLTRALFVQTSSRLRVFSLETGVEFFSETFPVSMHQLSGGAAKPTLGAICPLQSMLAFGCPDSNMVYISHMDTETQDSPLSEQSSKREALSARHDSELGSSSSTSAWSGLKRQVTRLRRVVHDLLTPPDIMSSGLPDHEDMSWLYEDIKEVFSEIMEEVWASSVDRTRESLANSVLGTEHAFGVIAPTQWPDPLVKEDRRRQRTLLDRKRTSAVPLDVAMSVYRGADKFRKKVLRAEGGDSSDSSSEGISSEYESDISDSTEEAAETKEFYGRQYDEDSAKEGDDEEDDDDDDHDNENDHQDEGDDDEDEDDDDENDHQDEGDDDEDEDDDENDDDRDDDAKAASIRSDTSKKSSIKEAPVREGSAQEDKVSGDSDQLSSRSSSQHGSMVENEVEERRDSNDLSSGQVSSDVEEEKGSDSGESGGGELDELAKTQDSTELKSNDDNDS